MKHLSIYFLLCLIFWHCPNYANAENTIFKNGINEDLESIFTRNQNSESKQSNDPINMPDQPCSIEMTKEKLENYHRNQFVRVWENRADFFFQQVRTIFSSISKAPVEIKKAFGKLFSGNTFWHSLRTCLEIIFLIAVAFSFELFFRKFTSKIRHQMIENPATGIISMIRRLIFLTLLDGLALHIFSLSGFAMYILFYRNCGYISYFVIQVLFTIITIRVVSIISNFLLSPHIPTLRLLPISEKDSIYIFRWSIVITTIGVLLANLAILLRILGISNSLFLMIYSFAGFLPINMIVYMIWDKRESVAQAIKHTHSVDDISIQNRFAQVWHIYATIYSYCICFFWEISLIMTGHDLVFSFIASFVIIPLFLAIDRVVWRILCMSFGHNLSPHCMIFNISPDDTNNLEAALNSRAIQYIRIIQRIIRIALFALLFLWVKNLWGFGHSFEKAFAKSTFIIVFTVLIATSVWEFIKVIIDEKILKNTDLSDKNLGNISFDPRKQTLITILRNVMLCVMLIFVCLIILSSIGINIAPLLAGAGVIGLGIGFGTQTLIKDIFSGIFFLIDDAFRIGDYVDTGKEKGTVENISLRSLRLRHHRGMVYTIPFGELSSITNYSRDWIVMNLDFQVPFHTDIDQIESIINKINKVIIIDPEIKGKLLDPLSFMGVKKIENSGMIMRICFKSKPGEQFIIRRQIYKYIHKYFDQEDIQFANRYITLHIPDAEKVQEI